VLTFASRRVPVNAISAAFASISVLVITSDFHLALLVFVLIFIGFAKPADSELPITQVILGLYLYLFVFRFCVISLYGINPKLGRVEISIEDMRYMLVVVSYEVLVIILILRSFKKPESKNPAKLILNNWLLSRNSFVLLQFLFFCTITGFFLMLVTTGSLNLLVEMLFSHRKITITQDPVWQLGLSLWSLFSTPYLTLSLMRYLKQQNVGVSKFFPFQTILILLVLIFVFGGRLGILIACVVTFSISKYAGLQIRKIWLLYGILTAVLFLAIGNARIGMQNNFLNLKKTLISATYPVLDASALAFGAPSNISDQLKSEDRLPSYLVSFIPRFFWPEKPLLTSMTLDTQIAQIFGYENQRGVTGWPSGIATEPYLMGGVSGVLIYAVLLGVILKATSQRCTMQSSSRLEGSVFVNQFCLFYFLIAILKDGDTLAAFQSGIRLLIWLKFLLVIVQLFQKVFLRGA